MKAGKLDSEQLKRIVIDKIKFKRPEVKTSAGVGEDCAVIDFGDYDCILSTDPITAAVSDIGRLAMHISCNDIASNGVEPLGILLAVMLPEGTTEEEIDLIMQQAGEVSEELGVQIIGGHTEITPAVRQPIIVSTAVGRALSGASQKAEDMRPGDSILLTKQAGIEGTGIIASDYAEELSSILSLEEISEAQSMLKKVSVVREGVIAGRIGTSGMHDITEGGILGAVWEMCELSGTGAELNREAIPVSPVTLKICAHFEMNYLRLISSGCMMIVVRKEREDAIMGAIADAGIPVACIGRITEKKCGRVLIDGGIQTEIAPPDRDELYKAVR